MLRVQYVVAILKILTSRFKSVRADKLNDLNCSFLFVHDLDQFHFLCVYLRIEVSEKEDMCDGHHDVDDFKMLIIRRTMECILCSTSDSYKNQMGGRNVLIL